MEKEQKNKDDSGRKAEYEFLIDEEGILNMKVPEPMTEQATYDAIIKLKDILRNMKGRKRILTDLRVKSFITNSKFRKRVAEMIKDINDNPETKTEKSAVWGASTVIRTIGNFVLGASGSSDTTKMFETKEEALKWLRK